MNLKVIFKTEGLEKNPLKGVITKLLGKELIKYYNLYAESSNQFIDLWNKAFEAENPNYFEINKGKDCWDLVEYNDFMRNKERLLIDNMGFNKKSKLLNFDIGDELNLIGVFKYNPKIKIDFFLKEM